MIFQLNNSLTCNYNKNNHNNASNSLNLAIPKHLNADFLSRSLFFFNFINLKNILIVEQNDHNSNRLDVGEHSGHFQMLHLLRRLERRSHVSALLKALLFGVHESVARAAESRHAVPALSVAARLGRTARQVPLGGRGHQALADHAKA